MTVAVRQLLDSYETLPDVEKHMAAVEILRRASPDGDLPDIALLQAADELFLAMDDEEARHAPS